MTSVRADARESGPQTLPQTEVTLGVFSKLAYDARMWFLFLK